MPEMDGYVLTQKIKDDKRFKKCPSDNAFVVVSGRQSFFGYSGRCGSLCAQIPTSGAGGRYQRFSQLSLFRLALGHPVNTISSMGLGFSMP